MRRGRGGVNRSGTLLGPERLLAMTEKPERTPELYDEQLQRKRQEKIVDPDKRDDEQKAARAEEKKA